MIRSKWGLALGAIAILVSLSGYVGEKRSVALPEGYVNADIKRGALLYDKWYKLVEADLSGNHPSYPAEGKKSGDSTWRCKECHGWDYIGKDGRYSKGSHFTGIKGVYESRELGLEALYQAIAASGSSHDFAIYLEPEDIWALVKFIREGLYDINTAIHPDKTTKGDSVKGQALYTNLCAECHGADGDALDFKPKKDGIQGIAYAAKGNPQETMHKILWGHPGSDMPSALVDSKLTLAEAIDILTYSQTLK